MTGQKQVHKWLSRVVLLVASANFIIMVWLAQYITSGWLIYLYVVGSFALLCGAMMIGE